MEGNQSTMATESKLLQLESTLKEVIGVLIDGQEGFQSFGEDLKDETLKHYFLAESLKRAQFKGELEDVLIKSGFSDAFKEKGTWSGSLHRSWGELKHKLGGGDVTLLETAVAGEDAAKKIYAKALAESLPLPVHQLLSEQASHILRSHSFVKAARESHSLL